MIQIMKANEVAKLSEEGKKQFEKEALESPEFKEVIQNIEKFALKGYSSFYLTIDSTRNKRVYPVISKALIEAGYKAELKRVPRQNLLGTMYYNEFHVFWESDEEQN